MFIRLVLRWLQIITEKKEGSTNKRNKKKKNLATYQLIVFLSTNSQETQLAKKNNL